jgi:hypothetical protein
MSTFLNPLGGKQRQQYAKWLRKLSRDNVGERVIDPYPYMPTFVELVPSFCSHGVGVLKRRHRLKGKKTMLYGTPNTIVCDKCGTSSKTRFVKVHEGYEGPDLIKTFEVDE